MDGVTASGTQNDLNPSLSSVTDFRSTGPSPSSSNHQSPHASDLTKRDTAQNKGPIKRVEVTQEKAPNAGRWWHLHLMRWNSPSKTLARDSQEL